jgi:hypothetical protein
MEKYETINTEIFDNHIRNKYGEGVKIFIDRTPMFKGEVIISGELTGIAYKNLIKGGIACTKLKPKDSDTVILDPVLMKYENIGNYLTQLFLRN